MELSSLWFILLTILFAGFFCLEGFDYGAGMLTPFLGKNELERRMIVNSVGPFWHGNEVWMITAGGAMFAAFPQAYATLFSGFYLALFLMLMALIARGCAFEFRNLQQNECWRNTWDWLICFGSFIPALLWGVAVTNLLKGVPINAQMQYTGSFFDLLSGYTLVGGVAFVLLFLYHGAVYLTLRVQGDLAFLARGLALRVGGLTAAGCLVLAVYTYYQTDLFRQAGSSIMLTASLILFAASYRMLLGERGGWAFGLSSATVIAVTAAFFWGLYPRLIVSSLNSAWSITIHNAASSANTLQLMTIAALILVPLILAYQAWAYWLLRHKITQEELEY
jgi:cytochrome d ubiquinol oxidase subunit II